MTKRYTNLRFTVLTLLYGYPALTLRLHDTTGCQTGCTTSWTTGCIV